MTDAQKITLVKLLQRTDLEIVAIRMDNSSPDVRVFAQLDGAIRINPDGIASITATVPYLI